MIFTTLSSVTDDGDVHKQGIRDDLLNSNHSTDMAQAGMSEPGNIAQPIKITANKQRNVWREIQMVSELAGVSYEEAFELLMKCDMDTESVLKLQYSSSAKLIRNSERGLKLRTTTDNSERVEPTGAKDDAIPKHIYQPQIHLVSQVSSISLDGTTISSSGQHDACEDSSTMEYCTTNCGIPMLNDAQAIDQKRTSVNDDTYGRPEMERLSDQNQSAHDHKLWTDAQSMTGNRYDRQTVPFQDFNHPLPTYSTYVDHCRHQTNMGFGSAGNLHHDHLSHYRQYQGVPDHREDAFQLNHQSYPSLYCNTHMYVGQDEWKQHSALSFTPTYDAPQPIQQYWTVSGPLVRLIHYGPSNFSIPEPQMAAGLEQ